MQENLKLLKYQGPMIKMVGSVLLNAVKKNDDPIREDLLDSQKTNILPPHELVAAYHKWLKVEDRYKGAIAPHLFPLWTYPQLFELGQSLNFPLHKVLNQGCKMVINSPLPIGEPLTSTAHIYDIKNLESKYRINQKIITGSKLAPEALVSEIYAVILKDTKSVLRKRVPGKVIDNKVLELIKIIEVSKSDARNYALISGDLNPIHLTSPVAKLMGLQGSIMHGFGLFSIVFETLQDLGHQIKMIDVRFLKPVYLGTKVVLFMKSDKENEFSIRVLSQDRMSLHMTGIFKATKP